MPSGQFSIGHPEPNDYSDDRNFHTRADTLNPASSEVLAEYLPIAEPSQRDRCMSCARRQGLIIHHS